MPVSGLITSGLGMGSPLVTRGLLVTSVVPVASILTRGLGLGPHLVTRGLFVAAPAYADLLEAIVARLKATGSVTDLLNSADSVYLNLSNWRQEMPFLLLEAYDETLPGLSAEDQPVEVNVCLYAGTVAALRALVNATKNALDSVNINPGSIRTDQFAWDGGVTTGVMRNRTTIDRVPSLVRGGKLAYDARIQYQFWITPNN